MPAPFTPDGFGTATPFIVVRNAAKLIDFMKSTFGAEQRYALYHKDGSLWHAQMKIGDSMIMVGDAQRMLEKPAAIYLYVDDVDTVYHQALNAGAISSMEPDEQFYGDRVAGVEDSFGNTWWFAKHTEDVSPAEMQRRARITEEKGAMA